MARASPRRKFESYKSGILNPRGSQTAFSASISSRRSGSLFRRRQVRLWRTTASIRGQNERFSKLYVCSNRYVIAGRLLPGTQYFSTPACSAAIGNASRALPLPGRKSYRMSAKSARAWLSLMEIATGPIVPAFPIFLQIRVQFKAKSVFITPLPAVELAGFASPTLQVRAAETRPFRPPGLMRERIETQSQNQHFDCRVGAGVAPTSTKLFSGIAKQQASFGSAYETESIPLTEYFPIFRVPEYSEFSVRPASRSR
jgi:hypothetical protein